MQTGENGLQGSRHSDDKEKDNEDKGKEDLIRNFFFKQIYVGYV